MPRLNKPSRAAIKAANAMYAPLDRPAVKPATAGKNSNNKSEAAPQFDLDPKSKKA